MAASKTTHDTAVPRTAEHASSPGPDKKVLRGRCFSWLVGKGKKKKKGSSSALPSKKPTWTTGPSASKHPTDADFWPPTREKGTKDKTWGRCQSLARFKPLEAKACCCCCMYGYCTVSLFTHSLPFRDAHCMIGR